MQPASPPILYSLMQLYRSQTPWPHYADATGRLCQLHWLPVRRQVEFKLSCLVRQALCGQMPIYLADDIHLISEGNRRSLRSSCDNMCAVPRTHNSFGDRSFGASFPLQNQNICFDKATALCDILYKCLTNTLTCVCRRHLQHSFDYFNVMEQQSMSQFCVVLWCLVCACNMLLTNTGCCVWLMQGQINGQEGYFPKSFVVMLSKPGKVGVVQLLYNSVFIFV